MVADHDVVDDLRRRGSGGLAEEPDADAEADGGLVHHPGQLAAADDADHRIHGASLLAVRRDRHAPAWAIHGRRVTTVGANRYESGSEPWRGRQRLDRPDRLRAS